MLTVRPTGEELEGWRRDHHLILRGRLADTDVARLRAWVDDLAARPETPGKWMKYFERGAGGEGKTGAEARQLCRVEDFVPYHDGLSDLIRGPGTLALVGDLMGEPAALFKEKINFKLPGGSGFAAHQDAPAFVTFAQRYHITMLIAIDEATMANGCLEISDPVELYRTLPQAPGGHLAPEVERALPWRPVELAPGDVVLFDSYIPHRSAANRSDRPRRALYVTYNRLAEGDRRDAYFADKRTRFPPECERVPGVDYSASAAVYNLGNPIR
jgi:2-aminoethylphosphonate dioxygenase